MQGRQAATFSIKEFGARPPRTHTHTVQATTSGVTDTTAATQLQHTIRSQRLPAMSSGSRERGGGSGGGTGRRHQFPVGRRRYVPVVDAGCGCRPRRPRLLSLPSFLKPRQLLGGNGNSSKAAAAAARRGGGGGEQYSSCASTSTAASFSSSSAATHSTTGYSSAYSSDYYYHSYGAAADAKLEEAPLSPGPNKHQHATKGAPAPAGNKKQVKAAAKTKRKKRYEKTAAAAGQEGDGGVGVGVGVAVEKESSDPRADFRDSMVQMVVEMGLCDWDGLRGMLRRLLALNAPRHHAAILTAFAEVCTQLAGAAAAAAPPPPPPCHQPSPPQAYYQYRL